MKTSFSVSDLIGLLDRVSTDMEGARDELTEIDAKSGDGDLGISVKLGFEAVRKGLPQVADADIGTILMKSGAAFNSAGASTFGTLMATAFMRAGRSVKDRMNIGVDDMLTMMAAAIEGIQDRGKASQGERTMLDAFIPAYDAMSACHRLDRNASISDLLSTAATAAREGAESTAGMEAKHGRAGWLGDRSKGVPDAGACAIALILECAARYVSEALDGPEESAE